YVSLIGNGIAIGRLVEHGWDYQLPKAHMGKWYKAPTGIGAGVMGLGYWCFATNVLVTIFQSRLVKVPKPQWHLWKYFATGAAALTVGTVQGVIQVQPANARWLYSAGHAGEWIDPISHAHINLVTGLTMLVAGALFALVRRAGGVEPSRRAVNTCFYSLLAGSLVFYFTTLYLGFHEGLLGGLMVLLIGLTFVTLRALGASWPERAGKIALAGIAVGVGVYYLAGIAFSGIEAHKVAHGQSFAAAVRALEPWQALVAIPAA